VIDAAEAAGLSLPASPYWEGVSVGGAISTGSHGSSWWGRGGAVHDHVVGLTIVVPAGLNQGWARVLPLAKGDALFPAALVSLGLLGVVSKVSTVYANHQLERAPQFRLFVCAGIIMLSRWFDIYSSC
jgi:FAD/FMN-containing dehydrogenase